MTNPETIMLPAAGVPVVGEYDVVVCGAGPAGIGAAIAAGREGAKTLLIEALASVGGMATAVPLPSWMDAPGGPIFDELEARLGELGLANRYYDPRVHAAPGRVRLHSETVKALALRMIREAGTDVLFCTTTESAWLEGGAVSGVLIVNKGGRQLVKAKCVIDCTADGDVAVTAGAEHMQGDPEDGRSQHVTYRFGLEGINGERARNLPPTPELLDMIRSAREAGRLHPPPGVFLPDEETFPYHPAGDRLYLNGWEIADVDPSDPVAVSNMLVECQLAALEVVEFCREHLPGYEEVTVSRFPALLATRESRRIVGEYVLTREDVLEARKFDDGIAKAFFYIDFHDSPPGVSIPHSPEYKRAHRPPDGEWYEIPYRCLVPKGVDGLLVAGRCFSADRSGLASARVMPTCMYMGTAAGVAAATAVGGGVLPGKVDVGRVRGKVVAD